MENFIPRELFLTKGVGVHKFQLSSFEEALRNAGMANQNLVSISSIIPPGCKIISREKGLLKLEPGAIRFSVIARISTQEHGRRIAASIGVAQPKDKKKWGYLSEYHDFGVTKEEAGDMAEDLAASMLGTTLGIEIDPDIAWNEREQIYKTSGLIVRASNVTQSATGKKDLWTTAVAMAVMI